MKLCRINRSSPVRLRHTVYVISGTILRVNQKFFFTTEG